MIISELAFVIRGCRRQVPKKKMLHGLRCASARRFRGHEIHSFEAAAILVEYLLLLRVSEGRDGQTAS